MTSSDSLKRSAEREADHESLLSKAEIRKDAVQNAVEATATTVGQVTSIITGAVFDVTKAVGALATEMFEIRDAAKKAERDTPVR